MRKKRREKGWVILEWNINVRHKGEEVREGRREEGKEEKRKEGLRRVKEHD